MKKILRIIIGSIVVLGGFALGFFALTSSAEIWIIVPVVCISLAITAVGVTAVFSPKHIKDALMLVSLF